MASKAATVILTGASRGIGLSILQFLLRANVNVVAVSRTETPELISLAEKFGGALIISKGDVAQDKDNKEAVAVAMASFGRLDALILNAGTLNPIAMTHELTGRIEEVEALFKTNYFSLISILTYALPHLKSRDGKAEDAVAGRVVLVSSGASTGGIAGWGAYSASKAAMNSLARTLGNEEPNIMTVSCRPGIVDTVMQNAIRDTGKESMLVADHTKFSALHTDGKLLHPSQPAAILAGLALKGDLDLSGSFASWDDAALNKYKLTLD